MPAETEFLVLSEQDSQKMTRVDRIMSCRSVIYLKIAPCKLLSAGS